MKGDSRKIIVVKKQFSADERLNQHRFFNYGWGNYQSTAYAKPSYRIGSSPKVVHKRVELRKPAQTSEGYVDEEWFQELEDRFAKWEEGDTKARAQIINILNHYSFSPKFYGNYVAMVKIYDDNEQARRASSSVTKRIADVVRTAANKTALLVDKGLEDVVAGAENIAENVSKTIRLFKPKDSQEPQSQEG
jgi:hypothetical protein